MVVTGTMKAARVVEFGKPYVIQQDVPIPQPKGTQMLLQVKCAGYCHTDGMVAKGDFGSKLPVTASHEPTGIVSGLGPDAKGFKEGDRVAALNFVTTCGKCPDCKAGRPLYCDNASMGGITTDGAFAEYMVVDSKTAVLLPDSLSFEQAAPLTCAGATIYNAIKACELQKGQSIGIVGLGALGHIGVQLGHCMGLKVVGIDAREQPIELVKSLKYAPDLCINTTAGAEAARQQVDDFTKDEAYPGLDAVILATDHPDSFDFAIKLLRKHGLFLLLGQPTEGVKFSFFDLIFRDIKVKGSLLADQTTLQELVNLVAEKGIEIKTKAYKLEQVNEVVELVHKPDHKGKLVVSFD